MWTSTGSGEEPEDSILNQERFQAPSILVPEYAHCSPNSSIQSIVHLGYAAELSSGQTSTTHVPTNRMSSS
jgi:hypothetical protein